ncbi:unnamed protein product, partial [Rotaria sordida]
MNTAIIAPTKLMTIAAIPIHEAAPRVIHLKRLPEDFRQESHILTEGHIEHYKSKLHAKRFINEREELKKRIDFVARNKKEQIKRLNNLQKQ